MYRVIALFTLSFFCTGILLAQGEPARVDTAAVIKTDSLDQTWTTRAPLTPEERQRRADKRAELADMKKRFRRFQAEASEREQQARQAAEAEDYLWSTAEPGGQSTTQTPQTITPAPDTPPEVLKIEISRNLQEGRNYDAPAIPAQPVLPDYPQEITPDPYDAATARRPRSTQSEIESSLREPIASGPDWQAKVATPTSALANPANGLPLSAGQIIVLDQVQFAPGNSQLYPEATRSLRPWAELLIAHPGLRVEVRAHTQAYPDDHAAWQLTQERAENIVAYWQQLGVEQGRAGYRGYGQLSPLVPANAPGAQQKNERIELIILELPTR